LKGRFEIRPHVMWGWRPVSGKKMESKDFDAKQKKKY
jgi:hypothetical protein